VIILADEVVGHMNERVVIPPAEEIEVVKRRKPTVPPGEYRPYQPDADGVAPWPAAGGIPDTRHGPDSRRARIPGDERRNPGADDGAPHPEDPRQPGFDYPDGKRVPGRRRSGRRGLRDQCALRQARRPGGAGKGDPAGLIKLETVWPFPEELIRSVASRVRALVMPEINAGQMVLEMERCAGGACPVRLVAHHGVP